MRPGINSELFRGLVEDVPAWAVNLPAWPHGPDGSYFLKNGAAELGAFLSATTDSVRLARAARVARLILKNHDMEEWQDLRDRLQLAELLHVIPYKKQTDHSAHTLYNYLLGLYIYLHVPSYRASFVASLDRSPAEHSAEALNRFLIQWIFASLLHDIGYVFQGRQNAEIRAVERLFRPASILRLLSSDPKVVRRQASQFLQAQKPGWIRNFEDQQSPEKVLDELRSVPWPGPDGENDLFTAFENVLEDRVGVEVSVLAEYAYAVAADGYDGRSGGVVDHAVATGLLLLSYASFWRDLAHKLGYPDQSSLASYKDRYYLEKDVIRGCYAAASHNVIGSYSRTMGPIDLNRDPLLFLAVLCDEVQRWDRFPAGEGHLVDLQAYSAHCTDSESLVLRIGGDRAELIVSGNDRLFRSIAGGDEDSRPGLEGLARLKNAESVLLVQV